MSSSPEIKRSWSILAAWLAVCFLVFWKPCIALAHHAMHNDNASHILLIPFIVAWLVYRDRKKMVPRSLDLAAALWFAVPAVLLFVIVLRHSFVDGSISLALLILALVLFITAGFSALFGRDSLRSAWFSMAFLLFLVPFPQSLLSRVIFLLQTGSAAVAEILFDWSGAPVLREGFVFHLPNMSIEVAQECSGIRSSIALLVLALLVAHLSFSRLWKKALFVIAGLLMMVVKNGVRITTLTLLANYIDPSFLYGRLHREGGIVFFLIGLALLWPVYWWLRRGEQVVAPERPEGPVT